MPLACLVVLASAVAGASDLDTSDPLAAGRQLKLKGGATALAETGSGITRDVGSIAVIEHDGSNYDKLDENGDLNVLPRASVAKRFYETHGDFYDALVVFTNFEFETGSAVAFHHTIRNDVRGINRAVVDNGLAHGSPGRLRGWVDMAALERYRGTVSIGGKLLTLTPGDPGFEATLNVVAHEVAHQWLTSVRYRDGAGADSTALLGRDGSHWSYLLDSDASVMEGADWTAAGPGSYRAARVFESYSPLDRYLMGLLDPGKVTPFTLFRNPAADPARIPVEGELLTAEPETVTIDQVIGAEGPRVPDHLASPKDFRIGFILLTGPAVEPSAADLEAVERVRRTFGTHFFALTHGVAYADTTLAEAPPAPRAAEPDLDKALGWLLGRQTIAGSWEDSTATAMRDTSAVVDALLASGQAGVPYQRGILWLRDAGASNLDYAARRALALAPEPLTTPERSALLGAIWAHQNADGGFGAAAGYESDPLDTALALRSLAGLKHPLDTRVRRALVRLDELRLASGAWPAVPGGEPSTVVTAHALLAVQDWAAAPEAQAQIAAGLAALLSRQNPDGGFGESPSTPGATALALGVLVRAGAATAAVDAATGWLQSSQLLDGSWGGSPFDTALVLSALRNGIAPNLVAPADSLVVAPSPAQEGDLVQVTARVRNTGRAAAGASRARLFDGDPATGTSIADASVPALDPGAEATVAFDLPTAGRAGDRTLFVVADADGEIAEAREDDNTQSRALRIEGPLPDLLIRVGDLLVTPVPPEEGETVEVAITVGNAGAKPAPASLVRLLLGGRSGGVLLGEASVPPLGVGEASTVAVAWDTTGALGEQVLTAIADAPFAVPESDETNNERSLRVAVTGPLPPGPDLEIEALAAEPPALRTVPQVLEIRAALRNLGRDPVSSTVAVYEGEPGAAPPLASQPVDLPPRSSAVVLLAVTATTAGTRTYVAVADPDGTVAETDEANNRASVTVVDPGNTLDLEILPAEVSPSAVDLVVGQVLAVGARVHNRGTTRVTGIPVILGRAAEDGLAELDRATVTLAPGTSTDVSLSWTTSITADEVLLVVRADPFGLLDELSESNNEAAFTVRVRPSGLPNLSTSGADIRFEPDPPLEGAPADVSAVVRNPGTVPAGPFVVRFFRGDPDAGGTLIGEAAVDGLDAGSSAEPAVTWSPVDVRGAQGVSVVVDALGSVEEYDEADNRGFRPFSVLGLPDVVLAAGDVALEPRFPRAGEPVTVRATVRNLGSQPAGASLLRVVEGEPGSEVGTAEIPALGPGAAVALELPWTPSAPPGERTLSLFADAADVVREQDEGNNLARRSVVVQDADLFLTAPYFSPDGDGVQDETTLAYRATGPVAVIVSNEVGGRVRTLAAAAPAAGSLVWDGRDGRGRLVPDGTYTFNVEGEEGVALGRIQAVVDTNRSSLHEAAGTGLVATRNLTCALPDVEGPAWMPAGDEALFIVPDAGNGHDIGLVRVTLDGEVTYVTHDPWYGGARFGSDDPVSPDGREALVVKSGELHAVDLVTGARRPLAGLWWGTWSPDGRYVAGQFRVVSREGTLVADLDGPGCGDSWAWSPDGEHLAWGNTVVRRDGTEARTIPPQDEAYGDVRETVWRGDGKIYTALDGCFAPSFASAAQDGGTTRLLGGPAAGAVSREASLSEGTPASRFLLDPDSDSVEVLSWLEGQFGVRWSPDGRKVLYHWLTPASGVDTLVAREDGSGARRLFPAPLTVPPRGTVGSFVSSEAAQPGGACFGAGFNDVFAVTTLQNLTVQLNPTRLPANNGILVQGTVADQHLDHYQLEYALQSDPETWHPIGGASEVPILDDVLGVWVPSEPGTYLLRLRASDRAGNVRSRTRVMAWDRRAALANVTQDEVLISPNGDGTKDAVTFRYLVLEPTRADVHIAGPETADSPGPTVRTFSLGYPSLPGPGDPAPSFTWDGRDESGQVVPDGRFTVFVNELPFRVDVDATPPDISWAWEDLRSIETAEPCAGSAARAGAMVADRLWHVVDANLKSWKGPQEAGTHAVYEPETDTSGEIVYEDGVPRVKRIDGRTADRRQLDFHVANRPPLAFEAVDHAGNRSLVAIPLPERLLVLHAQAKGCDKTLLPPIEPGRVYPLAAQTTFRLGETLRTAQLALRFQYRSPSGTGWVDATPRYSATARRTLNASVDFVELGILAGAVLRGRFVADGEAGDVPSEEFDFRVCLDFFDLHMAEGEGPIPVPGTTMATYPLALDAETVEPLAKVTLEVLGGGAAAGFRTSVPMVREGPGFAARVTAPVVSCDSSPAAFLEFRAVPAGESGRTYPEDGVCVKLRVAHPSCPASLRFEQRFDYCSGTPDRVSLIATGHTDFPASLAIERGPDQPRLVLGRFDVAAGWPFTREAVSDVPGLAEGGYPATATLSGEDGGFLAAGTDYVVDRTPATVEILQPPPGAQVCTSPDPKTGLDVVALQVEVRDAGEMAELSTAEWRQGTGPWLPLRVSCTNDRPCGNAVDGEPRFPRVRTGTAARLGWDVGALASGDYSVRLTFCDRAGNRTSAERSLSLLKEPPNLHLLDDPRLFSPNGDGRSDVALVRVRTFEALRLTATVAAAGGGVVRTLVDDLSFPAGENSFPWDGRDDAGQVVADGAYVVTISGGNSCGVGGQAGAALIVDTAAPTVKITTPAAGAAVGASVEVRGTASDAHFASYALSFGQGTDPTEWQSIGGDGSAVAAGLLGVWHTPSSEGAHTLRLTAGDLAGNQSEVRVTVDVRPRTFLDRLSASPSPFSPNGDGRRDTTTLEYALVAPGSVSLEIRRDGALVRRIEQDQAREPGGYAAAWDGRNGNGGVVADGEYALWIGVEAPDGAGAPEERTVPVVVDATLPVIDVEQPADAAQVRPVVAVHGSVDDANLVEYTVAATPAGGQRVELSRGVQNRRDEDLASLAILGDGPHVLSVLAVDAAENEARTEVPIVVDSIPPTVRLHEPAPDAVLAKEASPIPVRATVTDENPVEHVLSFGRGAAPAYFVEVARAAARGNEIPLGPWPVASLPDDAYVLRLEATDRAGNRSEAQVGVVLDGTAPIASLTSPAEGQALGQPADVLGRASDTNLAAWRLETSPGPAAAAFQWAPLAGGTSEVADGVLGTLEPLPEEGTHTIRLTVEDEAGHVSTALRTVEVDTTPPAAPTGLSAMVQHAGGSSADVAMSWAPNAEPDLAGYRVSRAGELLTPALVTSPSHTDAGRGEGTERYEVHAVDHAGNQSAAAAIEVRVDVTPPIVDVLSPLAGAAVSGSVDVRGTAFSADDFQEYRLLVGVGESPVSWTLLKRSTLAVSAGVLGTWTAVGDGPHVLALEAEDTSGNQGRTTVAVVADIQPPEAPALVSVLEGAVSDALVAEWTASPSADVSGYLVYRNGRIANAAGLVLGDPRAFLVPGPSYEDAGLPDGDNCYRIVAMDGAGNTSPPSDEICRPLDNRAPQAVILEPADGTRFEFPVRVVASTADRDVATVQFQVKPASDSDWADLGPADGAEPFEATLDPATLAPGPHHLRAVATETGGRTDPAPGLITVTYGDTTAPPAPRDVAARVDGTQVSVTWSAVAAPDLAGYHVFRDGERLTPGPIAAASFEDLSVAEGFREYAVTSVDGDGNESAPSPPAPAIVYALVLTAPYPVTSAAVATLAGEGSREGTAVQALRSGAVVGEAAAAGNVFQVPVALEPDVNLLTVRGVDGQGNRSIPTDEVVLISNAAPPAVTGLSASVEDHDVDLAWDEMAAPDLFGYLVHRGDTVLTGSVLVTGPATVVASPGQATAPRAFDGDPTSVWFPFADGAPATWTVTFPAPLLIDRIELTFAGAEAEPAAYRLEALWEGRYLPLARDLAAPTRLHVLPGAFATTALRLVLESADGLGVAEVAVSRIDVIPAGTTAFRDVAVEDGVHEYRVLAVDRYGASSEAVEAEVPVGDVTAPGAPTGLTATVAGSDVSLAWTPNPEADLASYAVVRDGAVVAEVPGTTRLDAGRPNGEYRYTVRALDAVGNESPESDPALAEVSVQPPAAPVLRAAARPDGWIALDWDHAGAPGFALYRSQTAGGPHAPLARTGDTRTYVDATVASGSTYSYVARAVDAAGNESAASNEASATAQRTTPPLAPVILFPARGGEAVVLDTVRTDVRGRADAGSLVRLDVDGTLAATATAVAADPPLFEDTVFTIPEETLEAKLSPDGTTLAYSWEDADGAVQLGLLDVATGATRAVTHPGHDEVGAPAFSPDSRRLSYVALSFDEQGDIRDGLYVLDRATDVRTAVEEGPDSEWDSAWSPDGSRLAFVATSADTARLELRDLESGAAQTLAVFEDGIPGLLEWSPDGSRIAFIFWIADTGAYQVRVVDVSTGTVILLDPLGWWSAPSWSPDGRRLAYTSYDGALQARIVELANGALTPVEVEDGEAIDPRHDPTGEWLSYGRLALDELGQLQRSVEVERLGSGERFGVTPPVVLGDPDAPELLLHQWTADGRLAVQREVDAAVMRVMDGEFEVSQLVLRAGDNTLVARAVDAAAGLASPDSAPVRVTVPATSFPDLSVTPAALGTSPSVPVAGRPGIASVRVSNIGGAPATDAGVRLSILDPSGATVLDVTAVLSLLPPGGSAVVSGGWTPASEGTYLLRASVDAADVIAESREDNNQASLGVQAVTGDALVAAVASDRPEYPARTSALVTVRVTNGGTAFDGILRTTVEDPAGAEVALVDARAAVLAYGATAEYAVVWNTGGTFAGDYLFRVRALPAGAPPEAAGASAAFRILPDVSVSARVVPERATVSEGSAAAFALRVENQGANTALDGLVAYLRVRPEAGGGAVFESETAVPRLVPGALWESASTWPAAAPAGRYLAELEVARTAEAALATAQGPLTVAAAGQSVSGTLDLDPGHVLAGDAVVAQMTVTNLGPSALTALTVAVELTDGPGGTVLQREAVSVDLAVAETRPLELTLSTIGLAPASYPVFLRVGEPARSLDRATLRVHEAVTAPSIDAPADGSSVATSHPTLSVNNASSAEGAALAYQFELYADEALTQAVPGATGVAEGEGRTAWTVPHNLAEDGRFFWRARATDGFFSSPWTAVASFTVDAINSSPTTPDPDTPAPEAVVGSNQPTLMVANAFDPDLDRITYELTVAADPQMSVVVASVSGLAEGLGFTEWPVPVPLDEGGTYYWSARAFDGRSHSAWSAPIWFVVDANNESPSAPVPLRPVDVEVATRTPDLVVGNAMDPEGVEPTYFFQVDREPTFDSPSLQLSPEVPEGVGETGWTPPLALEDDATHHWRAAASDGNSVGPWAGASFFVNTANDPPSTPVPLDPADGGLVTTPTPSLRVRNATDADRDVLVYDFEVVDEAGAVVASIAGVDEGAAETAWTVDVPLHENGTFRWTARARDAESGSPWTAPQGFRVNSVNDPPTAPGVLAPADGSVVATRHPALVVSNAVSPDGLTLTYEFEIHTVGADGSLTFVDGASGIAEGAGQTSWTSAVALADGEHAWRARARDSFQAGPWTPTARFRVAVDIPPAPPTGLTATPGDARVSLAWAASPEPDVTGYRVYRGTTSGGPYSFVATAPAPSHEDTGLANGTTYFYVVTAVDAAFESGYSAAVSATPAAVVIDGNVIPFLECVHQVGYDNGHFIGVFGYENRNNVPVTIPIGNKNYFHHPPKDRGQPTTFQPGRTAYSQAFSVAYQGQRITWHLAGRSATAHRGSPRCTAPPPGPIHSHPKGGPGAAHGGSR